MPSINLSGTSIHFPDELIALIFSFLPLSLSKPNYALNKQFRGRIFIEKSKNDRMMDKEDQREKYLLFMLCFARLRKGDHTQPLWQQLNFLTEKEFDSFHTNISKSPYPNVKSIYPLSFPDFYYVLARQLLVYVLAGFLFEANELFNAIMPEDYFSPKITPANTKSHKIVTEPSLITCLKETVKIFQLIENNREQLKKQFSKLTVSVRGNTCLY